jgi:hypothetical protein
MKQIGTPNNKAIYHSFGIIADDLRDEQEKAKGKGKFKPKLSALQIKALEGQLKAMGKEIDLAHLSVKIDVHNRTFRADLNIRNIESKKFDEIE